MFAMVIFLIAKDTRLNIYVKLFFKRNFSQKKAVLSDFHYSAM